MVSVCVCVRCVGCLELGKSRHPLVAPSRRYEWLDVDRARAYVARACGVVLLHCIFRFVSVRASCDAWCGVRRGLRGRHRGRARSRWHLRDAPRPRGTAVMAMCASYALDVVDAIVVGVVFVDVVAIDVVEGAKTTR